MRRDQTIVPESLLAPRSRWGGVLTRALVLVALLAPAVSKAQDPESFSEELVIGETGLLVDATRALSASQLRTLKAADLRVLVDDIERRVTRIEAPVASLSGGARCTWSFLIYVDAVLGSPRTVTTAALTVGQQTDLLTQMGCVDVVLADPMPRTVLSDSRDPRHVEKVLVDIAEQARTLRDADPLNEGTSTAVRDGRDRRTIREQWDRLIDLVASRRTGGPRVLLLISDGFLLSPNDLEVLSGHGSSSQGAALGGGLADIVMDTAQALSSYGWLTVALPMTNQSRERTEPAADEFERFREMSEGLVLPSEKRWLVNFFGSTRRDRATAALDDRLYEAYVLPHLAPLRALAEATAGGLAWREQQFTNVLERLARARLLWFESTEPHDGRVRRLQVRLAEEETFLRAPWWKRSSTPHLVAESMLRRLLAGEAPEPGLRITGELLPSEDLDGGSQPGTTLRLRADPASFPQGDSIGHIRVSLGFRNTAGEVSFRHSIDYEAAALGGDWHYSLPIIVPDGTTELAVGVEDLSLEEWGAVALNLSDEGEGM